MDSPRIVDGKVDIGAFESGGFVLSPSSGTLQSTLINTAFAAPLLVQVMANNPGEPVQGGQITFTVPATGASASLAPANPVSIAADGTASVTARANGEASSYQVTATTAGATSPATFDLTNTTSTNAPVVMLQPANESVAAGDTASFTATATGNPAPTVQWQVSTTGGATFSDISGATADTYSFTAAAAENGNEYRAVFTNSFGSTTSAAATLTINTAPVVITNPSNQTVVAGNTVTFAAAASGQPAPTAQWEVSSDGGQTYSDISGATADSYSFTALAAQNGSQYRAVFTNTVGSVMTSAALLAVQQPVSITAAAVDWGTQTAPLKTAADGLRLLPAGRNTDLPWLGVSRLQITLDQATTLASGDVAVSQRDRGQLWPGDDLRLGNQLHDHPGPADQQGRSGHDHDWRRDHRDLHPPPRRAAG